MKRVVVSAVLISMLGFVEAVQAATEECAAITPKEVASLFDRWNESLKTKDADKVVANYAPDAVLLATVSNKPRTNHQEIKDYFVHFLEKAPRGTINTRTIKVGCNFAQDVGTYTFSLKGGTSVAARYTYLYEYANGQWLIAHHHSSVMPEKTD
jgi:uncharacterized protein (TIGR02246 family)